MRFETLPEILSKYKPIFATEADLPSSYFDHKLKVKQAREEWLSDGCGKCGDCKFYVRPYDGLGMGGCEYEGAPDVQFVCRKDSCSRWQKKQPINYSKLESEGWQRINKDTIFEMKGATDEMPDEVQ